MSKVSIKLLKTEIVYSRPSEGLILRSNNNCWIHVISCDQWKELTEKFTDKNKLLGSHIECEIKENDVILIYVKSSYIKNTGFVAIIQTCSTMTKNDKNIKLYKNHNINKYMTNLEKIIILPDIIKNIEFKDIISQYTNDYKSFTQFTTTVLKLQSAGTFVKLATLAMGIQFIEYILEHRETKIVSLSDSEIVDKSYTHDDADTEENETKDIKNDEIIVSNIPIIMITCDKLRKATKFLKLSKTKIQSVIDHYMYCQSCDITNNNRFELLMTYNRIDKSSIQFCQNNHKDALNAYTANEKYPINISHEYIKIYLLQSDTFYTNDILIEFTTTLFPIIEHKK